MNKKTAFCIAIIMLFLVALSACTPKVDNPPYFVDRTEGWEPSLLCDVSFCVENFNYPYQHEIFFSYLFDGSNINEETQIDLGSELSNETVMENALKAAFGDRFCGIGQGKISVYEVASKKIAVYTTNQTMVLINQQNNALIQCIDLRLQPQFRKNRYLDFRKGEVSLIVDIPKLTRDEVLFFTEYFTWNGGGDLKYEKDDLPLTAQKAYEVTADDLYQRYANTAGGLGNIGGAFMVYDCKKSNSWLIVGGEFFAQMLDKTSGDRIFLNIFCTDQSKPV